MQALLPNIQSSVCEKARWQSVFFFKSQNYLYLGIEIILPSYNQNIFIWGVHVFVVPASVVWEHGALSLSVISGASTLLFVSKNEIESVCIYPK